MPDYNEILAGYIDLLIAYGVVVVGLALVYMLIVTVLDMVKNGD